MNNKNESEKYDLIAADFAKLRNAFYQEKKYLDLLIDYLKPNADILDVGCGSGQPIAAYLIEKGFQVTGIDASKNLLTIAMQNSPTLQCIYGDVRTVELKRKYDAVLEWWCLFHLPKADHAQMIARFASWLKPNGLLEFTTGDHEYEGSSGEMLHQELCFYSLTPNFYEKQLKLNGFKILLRENDQPQHLVWIAKLIK